MTQAEKRTTAHNLYLDYTPMECIASILKVLTRTIWGYKHQAHKERLN